MAAHHSGTRPGHPRSRPNAAHVPHVLARRYPRASRSEHKGVSGVRGARAARTDAGRLVVMVGYPTGTGRTTTAADSGRT
jgi:hypothetical protein